VGSSYKCLAGDQVGTRGFIGERLVIIACTSNRLRR
jgi:hypothetical protein